MKDYKIVKSQRESKNYVLLTVWHVVDTTDGFIVDAFDLKRDAVFWVRKAQLLQGIAPKSV